VDAVDALQQAAVGRLLGGAVNPSRELPHRAGDVVRDPRALRRLREGIRHYMPPRPGVKPSRALRDLVRTDDVYGVPDNLAVTPYQVEHLKLARRPLVPKGVVRLVSPQAREDILDVFKWVVKTDGELLEDADSGNTIQPYWDRSLKHSRAAIISFL
jgi:hypothetical protein